MVRFCDECGCDMYICQKCIKDICSIKHPSVYVKDIGNVCPDCHHKERISIHRIERNQ